MLLWHLLLRLLLSAATASLLLLDMLSQLLKVFLLFLLADFTAVFFCVLPHRFLHILFRVLTLQHFVYERIFALRLLLALLLSTTRKFISDFGNHLTLDLLFHSLSLFLELPIHNLLNQLDDFFGLFIHSI